MVGSIGTPIVDYNLAVDNQAQLLQQFQKTPDYANAVSYYQANIGKVNSVDALLGDRKLLTVALSAFQLESQVDNTGIWRQLLTQDPTQSTSLAQQLIDRRYLAFAKAFSSLQSDGGATIRNPVSIDAVLAGYQTNEYEKWVSSNDADPAVRQAMYFQRTVQDTIDISATGQLFAEFQQSPDISAAVDYYKTNIANVTSVSQLVSDPKLLDVALAAYKIDPSAISTDTATQLLTQNPGDPNSLAQKDPQYQAFADAFASLNTDGGVSVQSSASISAVVTGYETNQFEAALASNDQTANDLTFGSTGADQIATLHADFEASSGAAQATGYYRANIGTVQTVDQFVGDPQLLAVALGAYGLDPATSPDTVRQLITQNPDDPSSLAQTSPQYSAFAHAFSSLATDGGAGVNASVDAVTAAFDANHFKAAIGDKLQQATASAGSAATNGSNTTPSTGITILQVLSDPTLKAVVQGALGLPSSTGGLDVDQQIQAMTNAGFDVSQLQDPQQVGKLVDRFLANASLQSGGSSDPTGLAVLFGIGSDGSGGIDLSSLAAGGGGAAGGSGNGSAGSLVDLFA